MKQHTITFSVRHDYVDYDVECPYEPDDPKRPCVLYDMEPGEDPEGKEMLTGCGLKEYLTEGGREAISVPEEITSTPTPVDMEWDDDCPAIYPSGEMLRRNILRLHRPMQQSHEPGVTPLCRECGKIHPCPTALAADPRLG